MNAFCSLKMTWPKTLAPLFFHFFSPSVFWLFRISDFQIPRIKVTLVFWELFFLVRNWEDPITSKYKLGGGFNYLHYFYCQPDTWGNDPIWWAYFSSGLVQPPTSKLRGMKPKESLLPFHPLLSDEEFIIAALLDSHGKNCPGGFWVLQMGNWFWLIPLEVVWFWEPGTLYKQFKLDGNGETTIS